MGTIVFILGAGASAEDGCPCMANFMDVARRLRHASKDAQFLYDFDRVDAAQGELQRAFIKSRIDCNNIESIMGALEMAQVLDGLGDLGPTEVTETRSCLSRLIATVLELKQKYHVELRLHKNPRFSGANPSEIIRLLNEQWNRGHGLDPAHIQLNAPAGYTGFALLIRTIMNQLPRQRPGIITFNYDVGLDLALDLASIPYDYGIEDGPVDGRIPLCKLHGSLNWFLPNAVPGSHRPAPKAVAPLPVAEAAAHEAYVSQPPGSGIYRGGIVGCLPLLKKLVLTLPSGTSPAPFIVPPSESKGEYRTGMAGVWKRAKSLLAEAEVIFVLGYSLPETDLFFRQFFAISSISKTRLRRVFLYDKSADGPANRFRQIIDDDALKLQGGEGFSHESLTFGSATSRILELVHQSETYL